jgi:hypothetical protein
MPDRRKLDFEPEQHSDFILRVESDNRIVQFLVRLLTPIAHLLFRLWLWFQYRAHKSRRVT